MNEAAEKLLRTNPEKLRQQQLQMVQEWADRTGQRLPGAALIILQTREEPLTQEDYLTADGGGMELDDLLSDDEALAEMPEFFLQLPRGDSPGLY
jgi:hypothetical protein